MKLKPMSPGDAAWFHMDGPANTAVITSIMLTRTPVDFEAVKRLYKERLPRFERFTQRVVERGLPFATPHWEAMPDFSVEQQMHHVALPPPGDDAALVELISDLASTPIDRTRPLWDVHLVDGVGGGSALITRMHHCIADGTATKLITDALFGNGINTSNVPAREAPAAGRAENSPGVVEQLLAPVLDTAQRSVGQLRDALSATVEAASHPQESLRKAGFALAGAGMLAGELLRTDDPPSPLKGEFGLKKRVAWSAPVALADVKAIGAPLGAKINDVLVAGMTGALRTYLRRRGEDVDHTTVRAMVPVDLRPPERANELGNYFGIVLLDLAIRSRQRLQRVRATKANMSALKQSPEPLAALMLFNVMGRVPKALEDLSGRMFQRKASVVMTNVAGATEPLHLVGVPIERVMFWVPHPGTELGVGISILSYCGSATLGVISDARLLPDPEAITQEFNREFAAMLKAVREKQETTNKAASRGEPAIRKRAARTTPVAQRTKPARPRQRAAA
ncbi:MAG TPA: wax ester/triacylglycerol synthase family O-acyltransferase [Burkholderiaceae bacterium]|nr:wax ester/triacylglycerol synthase family O-acyltransferase [Burkholderiaceae bacterium]